MPVAEFLDRMQEDIARLPIAHSGLAGPELNTLDDVIRESGRRLSRTGRRMNDPAYLQKLAEASNFLADVLEGRTHTFWFEEAMSTSDFPLLMGDVLDRQLLGRYSETPQTWRNYVQRRTTRDFRTNRLIALDGLEGRLYPDWNKPEMSEPQEAALSESGYTWSVDVYERAAALNWRQIINDDLEAFTDIPQRFARAARRTEEYFAANLFVDASGPHASLYTGGNSNIVTGNPALSTDAIQDALTQLSQQTDADGEPIVIEAVELVVPPALEITANNIVNTREFRIEDTTNNKTQIISGNGIGRQLRVSVNHYIPVIASTANGNTSWFLFANPNAGRPALLMGFLRGYEEPGLYRKAANTERVGGGVVNELGDFDTNEQRFKVMHVLGGTRVDPKATIASNGSGS